MLLYADFRGRPRFFWAVSFEASAVFVTVTLRAIFLALLLALVFVFAPLATEEVLAVRLDCFFSSGLDTVDAFAFEDV